MKRLNILWIGLISVLMTACYDDYEKDYDESSVYFASQKPLRTLVADTDMSIKVGVAIGGKREACRLRAAPRFHDKLGFYLFSKSCNSSKKRQT